jgi:hypothetical protein
MKSSTRARTWSAVSIVGGWVLLTVCLSSPAAADVRIRFVNGRELIVREYWFAGAETRFSAARGTVGVPRAFVAAIEPVGVRRGIGGGENAVNAPPRLVAPGSVR